MSLIDFEVEEVQKRCENVIENSKLVTCINSLVRVDIKHSASIQITACLRFPENYPNQNILVELKSKSLSAKLLDGLTKLCEKNAKEILGKPQIIHVLKSINSYLAENPLCVVYQEILSIRQLLATQNNNGVNDSEIKLRQKQSCVTLLAYGGQYYFKVKINVPDTYPNKCIFWDEPESNLPIILVRFLNGQAREIARQCVEPPLRGCGANSAPFEPQPSFEKTLSFLVAATNEFHTECCPVCEEYCLPENAKFVVTDDTKDNYVERVYCGHLYHQGCLKKYMRDPPFPPDGKKCPAQKKHPRSDNTANKNNNNRNGLSKAVHQQQQQQQQQKINCNKQSTPASSNLKCGIRLSHDRWGLNIKLAEARWAQQQARVRELEEVIDFLQ